MKDTLYQVSTAGATIEGVIRGDTSFETLFDKGDFGLGTFDRIDGELFINKGEYYQCKYDGSIAPVASSLKTPFAQLTHFVPEKTVSFSASSFNDLDHRLSSQFENKNIFHALRIEGRFRKIKLRLPKPTDTGGLKEIVKSQRSFALSDVEGVAVGFWTPAFLNGVSVGGFHFHFLDKAKEVGGHVLDLEIDEQKMEVQPLHVYTIEMPETPLFRKAKLNQDFSSLLHTLEKG